MCLGANPEQVSSTPESLPYLTAKTQRNTEKRASSGNDPDVILSARSKRTHVLEYLPKEWRHPPPPITFIPTLTAQMLSMFLLLIKKNNNNTVTWAEDMSHSVKYLPYKPEDQSLNPMIH
jgi:hypothetical protein